MNQSTLLHRQINPSWIQQGRVTSQAFRPTPKDQLKLSVYNGDLISAADAWKHFTVTLLLKSVGVLAVSLENCQQNNLCVAADPKAFPEHALIDFTGMSENQMKSVSKILNALAMSRGWQYQAEVAA